MTAIGGVLFAIVISLMPEKEQTIWMMLITCYLIGYFTWLRISKPESEVFKKETWLKVAKETPTAIFACFKMFLAFFIIIMGAIMINDHIIKLY